MLEKDLQGDGRVALWLDCEPSKGMTRPEVRQVGGEFPSRFDP